MSEVVTDWGYLANADSLRSDGVEKSKDIVLSSWLYFHDQNFR